MPAIATLLDCSRYPILAKDDRLPESDWGQVRRLVDEQHLEMRDAANRHQLFRGNVTLRVLDQSGNLEDFMRLYEHNADLYYKGLKAAPALLIDYDNLCVQRFPSFSRLNNWSEVLRSLYDVYQKTNYDLQQMDDYRQKIKQEVDKQLEDLPKMLLSELVEPRYWKPDWQEAAKLVLPPDQRNIHGHPWMMGLERIKDGLMKIDEGMKILHTGTKNMEIFLDKDKETQTQASFGSKPQIVAEIMKEARRSTKNGAKDTF